MKRCQQCGRVLPTAMYRPYVSRGAGVRNRKVGTNTICMDCERFNNAVNYAYKNNSNQQLLDDAAQAYKELAGRGLSPKGAYAKVVLGVDTQKAATGQDYLAIIHGQANTSIVDEFNELLTIELTEEPDVYQDMLDKVRDKCLDQVGKVKSEYLDLFNEVCERIDGYEDNYEW